MKIVKTCSKVIDDALIYDWDLEACIEILCGEYLFMYDEFDEAEVEYVCEDYIQMRFHNEYVRYVTLQMDHKGAIREV